MGFGSALMFSAYPALHKIQKNRLPLEGYTIHFKDRLEKSRECAP